MGCVGSKKQTAKPTTPVKKADPVCKNTAKWTLEYTGADANVTLTLDNKMATGKQGSRVHIDHKNNGAQVTRYWFRLNPGSNKLVDLKIGLHHLNPIEEDTGKVFYVDDSWMVNLRTGDTTKETYVQDKDDYMSASGKVANFVPPSAETIVLVEIRGDKFSIWADDKELAKNVFTDKEIAGDNIYIAIDFEATDGDTIQVFGYDEFPASEPEYKPPVAAAPATPAGKKKTSEKKPAAPKPAPAAKK